MTLNPDIKIAFFDAKPYDISSFDEINKSFGYRIKYFEEHLNDETAVLSRGYYAVCAFVNDSLTKRTIEILKENNIKVIVMRCAGYNNVDLRAAFNNIHILRVPAYSPYSVAEHSTALMLALNRKIHKAYSRTREGNFNINGFIGFDMNGKTAGIIGTGKIGKVLISILKGFGMKILAFDHFPDIQYAEKNGFQYVDIDTLYSNSDIISLHCPLTKDTYHMINNDSLSRMKDNVMIINTSRGQLIDTKALIKALKSRKIGSAGLDVYEEESEYFYEDFSNQIMTDDVLSRLLSFNNVLITSHQAFFTKEALHNIAETTLSNVKDFYENKQLDNEICYKCTGGSCSKKINGRCF
jgi:D-lactate dehydrogenase